MLDAIVSALKKRANLTGWSVRHIVTRAEQLYAVPHAIESRRLVDEEQYALYVLRRTTTADGSPATGTGESTLLPGGNIKEAIDQAELVAGLVANPVHGLPGPAALPDVPLVDDDLKKDPATVMQSVVDEMLLAASRNQGVQLGSSECFGEHRSIHLVNSRGIDARQEMTSVDVEFVLHAQKGSREVETMGVISRRRASDLNVGAEVDERARYTRDLLEAGAPPTWDGAVVLRRSALADFMAGNFFGSVLGTLGSAASKYGRMSTWEIGKPVFTGEVRGDPLTMWATRIIPYGEASNRFDEEGLPAGRVELIRDNTLVNFAASQRYAEYLQIPATGDFGGVEVAPGPSGAATLLHEPYVEVIEFSWFNPDRITGDFATEIRLGYLVKGGKRKPFKGGQLIGNYMQALANARWSAETGFFGRYLGPHTVRFEGLKLA
ncbi:MAG: metallopeptidase TldD-related protein [Bacteroidota bacterium]